MDEADSAADYQARLNAAAVAARRPAPPLPCTGRCHYCGAEVEVPRRFCDSSHADAYEAGRGNR